jgi:predicted nucleotidyltransferase
MELENKIKISIAEYFSNTLVDSAWLFGSFATGKADLKSDIDIQVEVPAQVNLLHLAKMKRDLENRTGMQVDLLTEEAIAPDILPFVNQQKVLIYERKR